MHTYTIKAFATANGKKHACDIFHTFCGKPVHIATTRKFVAYPASVRARDEGKSIALRHAKSLNLKPENVKIIDV